MEVLEKKPSFVERVREKNRQLQDFRRFMRHRCAGNFVRDYLGTDIYSVREWIEGNFLEGMTWQNYGSVWVVDHIVPLRMFDIFDKNDLKICWHYKNLMPLFKEDNLKKEGNVFFAYELLLSLKDKDYFYAKLFERIEPEVHWMVNYLNKYQTKWHVK